MKKIFMVIAFSVLNLLLFSQSQSSIIKAQAMDMARAILKKDFPTVIHYMHPNLIAFTGGKEKLIERMDTVNTVSKQFGAEIRKVIIGNPSTVIRYKSQLQTTLPQFTDMKTNFGILTMESTLIAISTDGGKNWYFIDTSVYNASEVRKAMPELSPELIIPPAKPPKFTPNQQ